MYGLEKKTKMVFEFDLEKDLKKDPSKIRELTKGAEAKIHEIKSLLREGSKGSELDNLGVLLQGYMAFKKVLSNLSIKK